MPVVEKTTGGRVYLRPLERQFTIGDRVEVDEEMAAYLTEERGDFELVDELDSPSLDDSLVDTLDAAGGTEPAAGDDHDEEDAPDDYDESGGDDASDVDVGFDGEDSSENGWLDNDYQDRAAAVRAGGLDDYLDEIEAVETSDTVIDAVTDRRSELEG